LPIRHETAKAIDGMKSWVERFFARTETVQVKSWTCPGRDSGANKADGQVLSQRDLGWPMCCNASQKQGCSARKDGPGQCGKNDLNPA
jgi:hypothetical protein